MFNFSDNGDLRETGQMTDAGGQTKAYGSVCDLPSVFCLLNYAFLYFFLNLSTRPSVSISFCLPVKNG